MLPVLNKGACSNGVNLEHQQKHGAQNIPYKVTETHKLCVLNRVQVLQLLLQKSWKTYP